MKPGTSSGIRAVFSALALSVASAVQAAPISEAQREFFESRIRPILAQECYECHSVAGKSKGGLLLDSREGWMRGGESGAVLIPGAPENSLLLSSIRHERSDLKMPKAGAKLDDRVIEDFRTWIAMGAPDPRDGPPSPEELEKDTAWEAVAARRAQWWSFQPLRLPEVPAVNGVSNPVDRFIRARLSAEGLTPSPPADPRTLLRRLHFNLVGLPPSPEETAAFLAAWAADPDKATVEVVDRLLADPGFGERWARHWMDWIRYADTHGSEGDPAIPHAWRYRDYLVRALNEDVPLDRMVLEHFAGDLLPDPRVNSAMALNESALGLGHLRMVFHGFSPTDALDERVRFTDDQINTVTKAFLGLTVSCARCHDHKFDAISQADYYALFGIFTSTLPATIAVDAPGVLERHRGEMAWLKEEIRRDLGAFWSESLPASPESWRERIGGSSRSAGGTFPTFLGRLLVTGSEPAGLRRFWEESKGRVEEESREREAFDRSVRFRWDLSDPDQFASWSRYGEGLPGAAPAPAGEFTLFPGEGDRVVSAILPGGVYSHLLSSRHRAVLASAPFPVDGEYELFVRLRGEASSFRYVVQLYPRSGTIFPVTEIREGPWTWANHSLDYWKGDELHLELATAGDAPILVKDAERSWFGIREAVLAPKGTRPPGSWREESLVALFEAVPAAPADLSGALVEVERLLRGLLEAWGSGGTLTDAQALFLDEVLAAGWLPNTTAALPPATADRVERYRRLESEVPLPTRAPGVFERPGRDRALFVRGDHKQPAATVPRRFLEAIDPAPYDTAGTGRLEFARDLVSEKNPLTSRVLANRAWAHLFGSGIVATTDNFGRLGEMPSHPELLDWLAFRLRGELGWSLKSLVRELVLTQTWRQAGGPSPEALARDPGNRLLSSYPLRRLEAEAIRDALVSVSGELDRRPGGPPFVGPLPRRALYLRVKRNDLDPLMTTFDFPIPASTVGSRDVTNVPAQSLTLLNDEFLIERAGRWARRILDSAPEADDSDRIRALFEGAVTRPPTEAEAGAAAAFLAAVTEDHRAQSERHAAVRAELGETRKAIAALVDPLRLRLEEERRRQFALESAAPGASSPDLRPVARWDFDGEAADGAESLPLTLHGTARLENGALLVGEKGWASSGPLPFDLGEKSFEARVQLATLEQSGGGVITVQQERGAVFDSLVFGEKRPGEWLAGSEFFKRTLDFGAPREERVASEPVHLVLTYAADGTIRCYRNGEPWGGPVRKSGPQIFSAGRAEVLFGLRHGGGPNPGKSLRGRLLEARLYDRALNDEEVRTAFRGGPAPVARRDLEAVLGEAGTATWRDLEDRLARGEKELRELEALGAHLPAESRRWRDLAHAIFNLKEFIYLR